MATTEERLTTQEKEIAALKQDVHDLMEQVAILKEQQESASRIDQALLIRIDTVGSELQRFEKETKRSFEEIRSDVRGVKVDVVRLQSTVDVLVDAAKDHKAAIDNLAAGQQQIIEILLGGQQRRND